MYNNPEVLVVAGEVSGDLHAAPVIEKLGNIRPELTFFGAGGELLRQVNVDILAEVDELAVMGFSDIPRVLPRVANLKKDILRRVSEKRVPLAILVDYPGFNLNLARSLKKLPYPPKILYYIAPQAWAWRPGRTALMSRVIDELAVVFPFEVDFFKGAGVPTQFVGHPLLDEMEVNTAVSEVNNNHPFLALLPGSRRHVVKNNLPILIDAVSLLRKKIPDIDVTIGRASNLDPDFFQTFIRAHPWIKLEDDTRSLLRKADAAVVCSGTATLETALCNTPQVVVYKTSFMNFHIIKHLIRIKNIALVNVVAGRRLVRELIQNEMSSQNIADAAYDLLTDNGLRGEIFEGYREVRKSLGESGAAARVAEIAAKMLNYQPE